MGNYAICKNSRVRFTNEKKALDALLERHAKNSLFTNNETAQLLTQSASLDEALDCFLWKVIRDKHGKINGLCLDNKFDLFRFEEAFETLAPFIADGSFLIIHGEEGEIWRMSFRSGRLNETSTIGVLESESVIESLKLLITNPFWYLTESLRDYYLSFRRIFVRRDAE